METRARFVPLLLTFVLQLAGTNALSQTLFAQGTEGKKAGESVEPETMAVASLAKSKTRCEFPACAQKVIHLSNTSQPTEMQDIVNAMRTITEIGRVQQIPAARIIIIEGTAEQVAAGEKLAVEIDHDMSPFGELGYRIEFRVRELNGAGKEHTKSYSLLSKARQNSRVSLGRQEPTQIQGDKAAETKPMADSGDTTIECGVSDENEHTVRLSVEFKLPTEGGREGVASSPIRGKQDFQVELDRPTVISRIDDTESERSYVVELIATRVK